jgi:hypothetical protein
MDLDTAIKTIVENLSSDFEQGLFYPCFYNQKHFYKGHFVLKKNSVTSQVLTDKKYSIIFWVYGYEENEEVIIFNKSANLIEELLFSIYKITKNEEIYYCKINDMMYETKEEFENRSKHTHAKLFLTNQLEECCVCQEPNTIKTNCEHNFCRLCFNKSKKKVFCNLCSEFEIIIKCPVCRNVLVSPCVYEEN